MISNSHCGSQDTYEFSPVVSRGISDEMETSNNFTSNTDLENSVAIETSITNLPESCNGIDFDKCDGKDDENQVPNDEEVQNECAFSFRIQDLKPEHYQKMRIMQVEYFRWWHKSRDSCNYIISYPSNG